MLEMNKAQCAERAKALPPISEAQNKAEGVCAVDWALQLVTACRAEACGKSVPCRDGLWQLQELLTFLTTGKAEDDTILETLRDILNMMIVTGCDYTAGCAKLVLASMDAYADEYEAHVRRRCPALVCSAYCNLYIDPAACTGCGACKKLAPAAVDGADGMIHIIKNDAELKTPEFIGCCPAGAIKKYAGLVKPRVPETPIPVGTFGEAAAGGRRSRRRG
jgi:ferredoxin